MDQVDGTDPSTHFTKSIIFGGNGPYVGALSHSFLTYLGPRVSMLLLDCRAERKKNQVCSELEYKKVLEKMHALPNTVEHLIIQLGIPIAYPRMNFLETALESRFNPLTALGKAGSMGLAKFVNRFNSDAELLDDLNDHWTASAHKKERNWFIEQVQQLARIKKIRITFLSGDVHCAAVGVLKTLAKDKANAIPPSQDFRYMLNVVSSAIVNTPPPNGVLTMVGTLATKTHRTMHRCDTDETMIPVFTRSTSGGPPKSKYIMGHRNYCAVTRDVTSGDLVFDIRVEKERGFGQTVGYPVRAPAPMWNPI